MSIVEEAGGLKENVKLAKRAHLALPYVNTSCVGGAVTDINGTTPCGIYRNGTEQIDR